MRSPHVVIGYHHWGLVAGKFAFCLARACAYEGGRIKAVVDYPSPYTDEARNKLIELFLAMPPVDYFLMVDGDIEFEKDAVSKTMWVAENTGADVVWGNYALGTFANSLFSKDPESDLAVTQMDLQPGMIYEDTYAGGTGWCLIRRSLLEEMRKVQPGPWHWFDRDLIKNREGQDIRMGEDFTFGMRVHKMGRKQVGYTGILLVHHKHQSLVPKFMDPILQEMNKVTQEVVKT